MKAAVTCSHSDPEPEHDATRLVQLQAGIISHAHTTCLDMRRGQVMLGSAHFAEPVICNFTTCYSRGTQQAKHTRIDGLATVHMHTRSTPKHTPVIPIAGVADLAGLGLSVNPANRCSVSHCRHYDITEKWQQLFHCTVYSVSRSLCR